jgi:N-acetyl-alpha-D-muramate 1-phosphate uridylyltransferase
MLPRTRHIPKAMVEVWGEPFAAHQLRLVESQGFSQVLYCVGHLGEQIEKFVGNGSRFGLTVEYQYDGEELLGTAGALRSAFEHGLLEQEFALLYGDSYLPIDPAPIWDAFGHQPEPVLMTVYRNPIDPELNNVIFRDGWIELYRKDDGAPEMEHIDFGLSLLRRPVIEHIPAGVALDAAKVMEDLSLQHQVRGFEVFERYYEVGSPEGLADLEAYLRAASLTARKD